MVAALPMLGVFGRDMELRRGVLSDALERLWGHGLEVAVLRQTRGEVEVSLWQREDASQRVVLTAAVGGESARGEWAPRTLRELTGLLAPAVDVFLLDGTEPAECAFGVWLPGHEDPPPLPPGVVVLGKGADPAGHLEAHMEALLEQRLRSTPVCAGILIGGKSTRMGRPKQMLPIGNQTWLERIAGVLKEVIPEVVLVGRGEIPESLHHLAILPDAPEREGPLAGMLSAMRWRPDTTWLFTGCDVPRITQESVEWLLRMRSWKQVAVLPRLGSCVEPLLAVYEPRARILLESAAAPRAIAAHRRVTTPPVPEGLAAAWSNLNTPEDAGLNGASELPD